MNELSLINSLFNDVFDAPAQCTFGTAPRVDVMEKENQYVLKMELPGRTEKDVQIELDHGNLKISSVEEKADENKKNEKYLLRERRTAAFERTFGLPEDVDSETISASFKNGVLTILMNKKAVAAPKQIAIEAA